MESKILSKLNDMGNRIDDYLDRFEGDVETCEMLTTMFAQDEQFELYLEAFENGRYDECRNHIHGMKGAAANVGLTCISDEAIKILALLRDGNIADIIPHNERLKEIYNTTIGILTE